jgi:hypothetical protein
MDVLFYGDTGLGVPRLEALLDESRQAPVLMAWFSLYGELIYNTLALAIRGHKIIGALRLFGFNVFRNTYKPLLSESLVDFWGRYYYYFKELLVEFFFYPTFLGSFKSRPRLRILAATFAAAFAGNIYYHVIASRGALLTADFAGIWQAQNPRILYCFLLATGIAISMLRRQAQGSQSSPERASTALGRLRRIAGVWTFYAIIQIWNIHDGSASFRECVNFCLSLFGW